MQLRCPLWGWAPLHWFHSSTLQIKDWSMWAFWEMQIMWRSVRRSVKSPCVVNKNGNRRKNWTAGVNKEEVTVRVRNYFQFNIHWMLVWHIWIKYKNIWIKYKNLWISKAGALFQSIVLCKIGELQQSAFGKHTHMIWIIWHMLYISLYCGFVLCSM